MAEWPSAVGLRKRACISCTAGKSKCTPLSSDECERCHRLGKDCHYTNVSSTRRRPKASSRLQMLERKVEELAARQAPGPSHSYTGQDGSNSNSLSSGASPWHNFVETPSSSGVAVPGTQRISSIGFNTTDGEIGDVVDRGLVTLDLAHILLSRFRHSGAQQFPFVVINPDTPLNVIRKETPLLFLSIVAAMIFDDPSLQSRLGEEVRTQIFQRLIFGFEKSLEILQGLLVFAAWYCYFYRRGEHQVLLVSQLCVTLAHDLGIDKTRKRTNEYFPDNTGEGPSPSLNNAHVRAFLGTYYLSCLAASSSRTRSMMAYTKHMDRCCQSLAKDKEYPTDVLVPHLVRSQELARRAFDTFSYDDLNNTDIRDESVTALISDAFIRDLDCLQLAVPQDVQRNKLLVFEFHALRILIHETVLHGEFWNISNSASPSPKSSRLSAARSKMLWSTLQSCKAYINTFLSYHPPELFSLTAFTISRLCYTFITLAKLVHLDWDEHAMDVAREADFPNLASKAMQRFNAAATGSVTAKGERDAMSNFAAMMRILITGYEKQMKEKQDAFVNGTASAKEPDLAQYQMDTGVHPTSLSGQEIDHSSNNGAFVPPSVEQSTEFEWEALDDTVWDQILENFSMVPFP